MTATNRIYETPDAPSTYSDHYMLVDKSGAVSATKVRADTLKAWVLEDVVPGYAGSSVATQANGAANAGQKTITVDNTDGFLPGAPIAYTLVGGVIESNTVATVTPTTTLTVVTNIGAGGIADNTFIMVVNLGSLTSTGAVTGASSVEQVFTKGISLPVPTGAADHFVSSFAATFSGVVDPISTWGYNALRGGRVVANVGTAAWSIEADYYATANSEMRHLAETYFATNNDAGTAARRWIALTVDREVPEGYSAIEFLIAPSAAGQLTIGRSDTTASLFQFIGTGEFALLGANKQILFSAGGSLEVTANAPLGFIANGKVAYMSPSVDGFEFGGDRDTSVYRGAANTLQTPKALKIGLAGANHGYLTSDDELYINADGDNSNSGDAIIFGAMRQLGSGGAEWMRLTAGALGIGTVTPDSRLDIGAGALTMAEMSAPSAPAANGVVIYAVDNGGGKTQLMALFPTGVAQQIAIEP